ncbi:hypothetical protein IW261DRAFT_1598116 [Armillaria novae-zelandiae]|uniref:Uncharacterized protein n=1 Tax=Armillaria novae-zelandiae TaxID=153914 RepID=A0AA39NL43_9AGAR|nr:hypothetical protein IW261DRAFT_1598116 [Armillaria novae-zelandiae]
MGVVIIEGEGGVISCKVDDMETAAATKNRMIHFVEFYSICVRNLIPEALEALEKSTSPLEARRMRIVTDSAGRMGTTGLVTVYTAGRVHLDGISKVTAMPDTLLKSVVIVLGPTWPDAVLGAVKVLEVG